MSATSVAADQATAAAAIGTVETIIQGWTTQYSLQGASTTANGAQFIKDGGVGNLPSKVSSLLRQLNSIGHG